MIVERAAQLRAKLASGQPAWGAALSSGSPLVAEQLGSIGFDWVMIDEEHAPVGVLERTLLLQALSIGQSAALVRVARPDPVAIGQCLDAGAAGVIVPGVEDPQEAAAIAPAFRYPPTGSRGIGPYRPMLYGGDFVAGSDAAVLCILMVESVKAIESLDETLSIAGIDAVMVGPGDLSLSCGAGPHESRHRELCDRVLAVCQDKRVVAGMFAAGGSAAKELAGAGWQLLNVALESQLVMRAAREELTATTGG
jgi:4-hydroxy-2-oxoheptanedioate aldolase